MAGKTRRGRALRRSLQHSKRQRGGAVEQMIEPIMKNLTHLQPRKLNPIQPTIGYINPIKSITPVKVNSSSNLQLKANRLPNFKLPEGSVIEKANAPTASVATIERQISPTRAEYLVPKLPNEGSRTNTYGPRKTMMRNLYLGKQPKGGVRPRRKTYKLKN